METRPKSQQYKPKSTSVVKRLFFYSHSASYDNFSILTRENKKF